MFSIFIYFSFFLYILSNSPKEKENIIKIKGYVLGLFFFIVQPLSDCPEKELS